jgi:glycosyltransferase involved in cell wall biosynthesis
MIDTMDLRLPTVSVIIPTKNRPQCLDAIVGKLLAQTVRPQQLIIVDQSESDQSRRLVEARYASMPPRAQDHVRLCYLHDRHIPGAAVARNRGMEVADGDVWLFVDDDMGLELEFVKEILTVYARFASVDGVSGIITNYSQPRFEARLWAAIFLRGPFRDERQSIYWNANRLRKSNPIRVTKFGSGLMSFRASVVRNHRFHGALRGLPPGEDVDFCARLGPNVTLVMAPRARTTHDQSPIGRTADHWLKEYAQGKLYPYYRNWSRGIGNHLAYAWFTIGCAFLAVCACLRRRSLAPWLALLNGLREAAKLAALPVS